MTPEIALLLGILVGFVLGGSLVWWALGDGTTEPPEAKPEPARTVVDRYRPTARGLASQVYLAGIQASAGRPVPAITAPAVLEAAQKPLDQAEQAIAHVCGEAYVAGACEVRNALARESAFDDPRMLDQALSFALAASSGDTEHKESHVEQQPLVRVRPTLSPTRRS